MVKSSMKRMVPVIAVIMVMCLFTACDKLPIVGDLFQKKVKVADFVTVEFYGENGEGMAELTVDYEELGDEIYDKYKNNIIDWMKEQNEDVDMFTDSEAKAQFKEYLEEESDYLAHSFANLFIPVSDQKNLSNGDEFEYEIYPLLEETLEMLEDEFEMNFDLSTKPVTVKGLS